MEVATGTGTMRGRAFVRSSMPMGLVRVPHGWWKPESRSGLENMSGMWSFADAQITPDEDPDLIDLEQCISHLKGAPCRVTKLNQAQLAELEAIYGPTDKLPRGPEGKMLKTNNATAEYMQDDFADAIEFEAVELSLYARSTI